MSSSAPPPTADPVSAHTERRRLPLWVALALSLATVGPTLAMSGNGQGLVASVGKGLPLVFVIGLVGVALVGYSFYRLTQHLNHAGSSYALVGATVGPRAGFFSGFAMLGAYVGFSIGTLALTAAFVNAFLAELQPGSDDPFQLPWLLVVAVGAVVSVLLTGRDVSSLAKLLLAIEGVGIVAMLVLVVVIFGQGGAPTTGIDLSTFSFGGGVSASAVVTGVVSAFLSWAGFEACASMGEETDDPQRNIPRALAGTLALTGVLFVVVMFAQTVGFGTDAAGLEAFASSGNTLGVLGSTYVGQWFSLVIIVTATVAAFACHLATASTSGRMVMAFARDGFGPAALGQLDHRGGPRRATQLVVVVSLVANLLCGLTGWPDMGSGSAANDAYYLFAIAGSVCLMVCYLMVEVAAAWFVGSQRFHALHGGRARVLGVALPVLGALVIAVVLWFNVKGATTPFDAPVLGLWWCLLGLVVALAASRTAKAVGARLTEELITPTAAAPAVTTETP